MRANEFITEADSASVNTLITTLNLLRPKTDQIRVDSLINLVRRVPGNEMFNVDILLDAYKTNDSVKNLIQDIKTDESDVKYVYLKNIEQDEQLPGDDRPGTDISNIAGAEQTVNKMSKRALMRRGG